jgi:hypothetical protein
MPEQPKGIPIDELIRNHKVPTVATPPPVQNQTTPKPPNGAQFMGQDGKWYYRYEIQGEIHVLPKPIEQMSEQDFFNLPITLYDQQIGRLPQDLTVKFKDPQWAGYWFNRKARDGVRVGQGKALGFVPAKKEDLEWYAPHLNDEDGGLINYDLVLMKIHKAKLYGVFYKQAMDQAKMRGGIDRYKTEAENTVRQGGGDLGKAPYYITPQAKEEFQGLGPVANLPTVGER